MQLHLEVCDIPGNYVVVRAIAGDGSVYVETLKDASKRADAIELVKGFCRRCGWAIGYVRARGTLVPIPK